LISHLTTEHQQLLGIYQDIDKAREKGSYNQVSSLLSEFGGMLRGHLLTENVKLYVYLKIALKNDVENASIMQQFRSEMMQIGKAVMEFLEKYEQCEWDELSRHQFNVDFTNIGKVLGKRIHTEEDTLYPLYMPPGSY